LLKLVIVEPEYDEALTDPATSSLYAGLLKPIPT
jgi:hypothetical protein